MRSRRHRFGLLLLGLGLGCSRANSSFDDTEGTQTSGSPGTGSSTTDPDTAGTNGSDPGTTAPTPDPDSTDEGSTAPPEPTQVVVFPGPLFAGDIADPDPFATLEDECHFVHDESYPALECPNEIWGMVGTEEFPLSRYPMLDGGAPLFGVPIYASDLETVIADSYGDLVLGFDIGSLEGTDLVDSYWWGRSIPLSAEPTCQDWTSSDGALQGGAVQVLPTPPWFAQVNLACDVPQRVLCLCF